MTSFYLRVLVFVVAEMQEAEVGAQGQQNLEAEHAWPAGCWEAYYTEDKKHLGPTREEMTKPQPSKDI